MVHSALRTGRNRCPHDASNELSGRHVGTAQQYMPEMTLKPDITQLDDLLGIVAQGSEDKPARVIQEHLREACQRRAAGMFPEYVQELEFARRAAGEITSSNLRRTVDRVLAGLIEVAPPAT